MLDRLEACELSQANLEDVLGLTVADSANAAINAAFGSSDSRMMRITSSMLQQHEAAVPRECGSGRQDLARSDARCGSVTQCADGTPTHSTQDVGEQAS